MKRIILGLLLSAAPPLMMTAYAGGEDCDAHRVKVIKKVDLGGGNGQGESENAEPTMVWVSADGEDDGTGDGRSEKRVVKIMRAPEGDDGKDAERGWLGVSIGEVPDSVATQLEIEGEGVIVLNVVKDGPADKAGVQAHDVIVSVDGQEVGDDVGRTVELMKSRKPGDTVNVVVLRNGEETTLRATLGSRADQKAQGFAWKFDTDPQANIEDDVRIRGKMMVRDPSGKWTMKDLGDLDGLKDLPDDVKAIIPKSGSRSIKIFAGEGDKNLKLKVQRNGNTLTVEQPDGGAITVTRADAAGQVTTNTYQTADELRAADEEAFDLYNQAEGGMVFHDGDGHGDVEFDFDIDFDFDGQFDSQEWNKYMADLHKNLQESLRGTGEAYEEHMEKARELMEKLHGPGAAERSPLFLHHLGQAGKPKHTFEVRTDGTIEVKIRKGDSELVQLYRNEADLKARDPQMYEKYDDLMSSDED